ncbi:MAG: hypothetical protein Q9161_006501 [Pseudevernia consocians]
MYVPEAKDWHFDVDKYLKSYVPRNLVNRLPKPLSHFLGHRNTPRTEIGNIIVAGWALLGAFVGVATIEAAFMAPTIKDHEVPLLIGSFGAAAILEFNTIESPLAQPRNTIIGHILSAAVGVGITKLFKLNADFENLRWLAGALACGLASAVMTVTKTVYPPAGATALLAAVDPQVEHLGWYLLPLVLLSTALTLTTSLVINNIQRQYPTYWWTPASVGTAFGEEDIEKVPTKTAVTHIESTDGNSIRITADDIMVPDGFYLAGEEGSILEILQDRLRDGLVRPPEPSGQI